MEIVQVTKREQLDFLYGCSALTIEGLAEDSFMDFMDFLKENTEVKAERLYVTKGRIMNDVYCLAGENAYPDDLNIVSASPEDVHMGPMATKRFEFGSRWFDDIANNNKENRAES